MYILTHNAMYTDGDIYIYIYIYIYKELHAPICAITRH